MPPTAISPSIRRLVSLLDWYSGEPMTRWSGSSSDLDAFQTTVGGILPTLFAQLALNYRWNEASCEWIALLPNPTSEGLTGLAQSVQQDNALHEVLRGHGLLQFGRPANGRYDPVCFATDQTTGGDCPVLRIDHERILQHREVKVVEVLAPSFSALVDTILADDPA